jgi:hypothetical protein
MTAGMIETVKDALLADLRALYGDLVTDPTLDITLIVPPTFNRETRAPQIILTDFILVPCWPQGAGVIDVDRDETAGTVDEINAPIHRHIEFAVTAVARSSRAAERMSEAMTVYFGSYPRCLEFTVGEGDAAYAFKFPKELAAEFRDATQPNDGGLFFYEGRARIVNVPIYDGVRTKRRLATGTEIAVRDIDSEETLVTAIDSVNDD